MIICPYCKENYSEKNINSSCNKCGYEIRKSKEDVVFLSPNSNLPSMGYSDDLYEIFRKNENKHFWFKARKNIILELLSKYVREEDEIIEIGTGTGLIAKALQRGGFRVSVGDICGDALSNFKDVKEIQKFQFDLIDVPFKNHFDVVGMFDVLEHIKDDKKALKGVYKMLKDGGRVILTVPAHMWLWSKSDFLHERRYNCQRLRRLLKQSGLEVVEIKHFFVSIIPLLFLRSILNPSSKTNESNFDIVKESFSINESVNNLLYQLLRVEKSLLRKFSPRIGGSISLVAEKRS